MTSPSELERARRALLDAQRDLHFARQVVLRSRSRQPLADFVGNQLSEIAYEYHRDALYAALSWLWDVQERSRHRTFVYINDLVPAAIGLPSMTARRKEAA